MILTDFDLYPYRLPLVAALKLGDTVVYEREGILVRLASHTGTVGWGDVAPLPGFSRETLAEARQHLEALRDGLLGWAITSDWIAPEGAFMHHLDAQNVIPSVRFGLELAVWNLYAAARHTTLARLLAPQPRATVSLGGLLTGSATEVLEGARRFRDKGFRAVKLKVGRRGLHEEIDLVRGVRHVLGPDVGLRLDANRAWSLADAATFAQGVFGLRVEYIEEPLADPDDLLTLAEQHGVSIALDETLREVSADALGRYRFAHAFILKPTLLGGLVPTLRMARRAAALGVTPVLSAAFETGVGMQGLLALAAALGPDDVPAGLDTYRWLPDDVLTPRLNLDQGSIDLAALARARHTIRESVVRHD